MYKNYTKEISVLVGLSLINVSAVIDTEHYSKNRIYRVWTDSDLPIDWYGLASLTQLEHRDRLDDLVEKLENPENKEIIFF